MKKGIILLLVILFQSCNVIKQDQVTIIGVASNLKRGAIISDKDGKGYFIDNLEYWDEKFLFKQLKVTGKIKILKFKVVNDKNVKEKIIKQRVYYPDGEYEEKRITKAKWELYEK